MARGRAGARRRTVASIVNGLRGIVIPRMNAAVAAATITGMLFASAFSVRAATPAANGYVGKGTLVVRAPLPGTTTPIDVGAHVTFEQRSSLFRLDILDVALPGAGAVGSALATQLFPPGGATIVIDSSGKRYTVWSNTTRKYYTTTFGAKPSASPAPVASTSAAPNPFGFERSLRDLAALNISLSLAGHGNVDGHPATGVNYGFTRTTASGERTDAHGTVEFADDLDGVPVQLTASFTNKNVAGVSLRADATQLSRQVPAETDFQIPSGFAPATSIGDVIGRTLPIR